MSFVIVGSLSTLAGIGCLIGSETFGLAALLLSALFGSATAVALPGLGGIQPTHLMIGFLAVKALSDRDRMRRIAVSARSRAGLWLLATWAVGMVCTLLMPRLFDNQILVNPIRAEGLIEGASELPLAPTPGNITQCIYFTADVATFLLVSSSITGARSLRVAADIYLAYCAANLFFGAADLVTAKTGTTAALEFMRNATYTIYDELDPSDVQRVKGSFTEASSFAFATIGCFCFSTRLALAGIRPRLSTVVAVLSLGFIFMSTSSTGYLAALFCIVMLYGGALIRLIARNGTDRDLGFVVLGPLLAIGVILFILTVPSLSESLQGLLNAVLFDKASSQSGVDRSALNATGLQAFFESYGLGVGIGSTRTSSLIVAALSNLGLVGALAYAGFLFEALRMPARTDAVSAGVSAAVRCALAGSLVAAILSGALVDLGVVFFALVAFATADPAADPCAVTERPSPMGALSASSLVTRRHAPSPQARST